MPAQQAFESIGNGIVFANWPIMWIVVNAMYVRCNPFFTLLFCIMLMCYLGLYIIQRFFLAFSSTFEDGY